MTAHGNNNRSVETGNVVKCVKCVYVCVRDLSFFNAPIAPHRSGRPDRPDRSLQRTRPTQKTGAEATTTKGNNHKQSWQGPLCQLNFKNQFEHEL